MSGCELLPCLHAIHRSCAGLVLGALLGAGALTPALAQGDPVPPGLVSAGPSLQWGQLNASQRQALAPLHDGWNDLDDAQRLKWLEVADRLPRMTPESRERLQSRMRDWSRLTPAQRAATRERYREARQVDPAERRARWEQFQSLPPEERQRWADRSATPHRAGTDTATQGQRAAPESAVATPRATPLMATPDRSAADQPRRPRQGATSTWVEPQARRDGEPSPLRGRIVTSPSLVDGTTLLPRSGPQAVGRPAPAERPRSAASQSAR